MVSVTSLVPAQTQDSYEYNSEFTWGINKNSAGGLIGGLVFKKARKLNTNMLETYGLEIINVKHPQEVRHSSVYTGNFFIYGKSNYLYALRFQYGRDFILFSKAPQQGVEIKGVFAAGPSLGIVAPYYIERAVDNSIWTSSREQYNPSNPDHAYSNILGTGNLFEGIGDSKIQLGANLKAAINFELGFLKSQVTGFEVGILVDSYFKKVEIMPSTENKAIFPTVFFTMFYGSRK
ncbi:MAG: hypothetical protein E6Q41_00015 [Cyclobacteriaceae bacterium]|nr:MAG: hypothetical protein E6Q41_00015 [Cyclobacteriaceae bacterium]